MIGSTVKFQDAADVIDISPPMLLNVNVSESSALWNIILTLVSELSKADPVDEKSTDSPSHVSPLTIGGNVTCAGLAIVML